MQVDKKDIKELCSCRAPPEKVKQVLTILAHIFDFKPEKKGVYPNYEFDYF